MGEGWKGGSSTEGTVCPEAEMRQAWELEMHHMTRGRSTGNLSGFSGEEAGKPAGSLTQENGLNPLRVSAGMGHS